MSTPGALSFGRTRLPDEQGRALRRAIRLEWVTLGYMATCIVVVFFAMGSSRAMKAAWGGGHARPHPADRLPVRAASR